MAVVGQSTTASPAAISGAGACQDQTASRCQGGEKIEGEDRLKNFVRDPFRVPRAWLRLRERDIGRASRSFATGNSA
jgi:hypothetical protein